MNWLRAGRWRRYCGLRRQHSSGEQDQSARDLRADGLGQLHFSCSMTAETADGAVTLRRGAASLATIDPAVGAALTHLAAVYPDTRTVGE